MGQDGPHSLSTLYQTLRLNFDGLDDIETGPSKASAQDERALKSFQQRERRSKARHD